MAKKRAEKKCRSNSGGFCMTHWSHIDEDSKVCEFVEVSRENKRLRDGIEELADWWQRIPGDGGYEIACRDHSQHLRALLNPPQEEHDEFANITGDEAMRYGWTV